MRILYIHQYFSTRSGATGTRSYEFARRWIAHGHQVTMVTGQVDLNQADAARRRISREQVDGIQVLRINTAYSNKMGVARRLTAFVSFMFWATWAGLFRAGPLDVVLATSTPLTVGIPGFWVAWWRRVPFIFEIRDLWPQAPIDLGALRQPLLVAAARTLERWLYRLARRVVTLSPGMVQALETMGVPSDKLAMIPNCSDTDLFQPGPADAQLVEKYATEGRFVLIYAGAMGQANGLTSLVETARVLQQRGESRFLFMLVGDGSERPLLEELARRYGLTNLRLLPPMPKSELAQFLRLSDVILTWFAPYPVLATGSPNKLFDGLALGRPVLINFGGWLLPVLHENQAGVAVPSDNPEELAQAILELARDPQRLAAMGRNARRLAEERYDRDLLSDQMEQLLGQVVEEGKR